MMRESSTVDKDQFLKAPALFKFGPWALLLSGVLITVFTLIAGQWRVVEGRKGEYEKAFLTAKATALATSENLSLMAERLWQASNQALALSEGMQSPEQFAVRLESGLGLKDTDIRTYVSTADGRLVQVGPPSQDSAAALHALALNQVRTMEPGSELLLARLENYVGAVAWTPFVHRMPAGSYVRYVVHLVGPHALERLAQRSLGPLHGWVSLQARDGQALVQTSNLDRVDLSQGGQPLRASSMQEAMGTPLDFESNRLLTASTPSDARGVTISVGLREADVLQEFQARVKATWLIILCADAGLMLLVILFAFALTKFARTESYLRRLATTDILTSLPNRRSFQALLSNSVQHSSAKNEPFALFFLDLDNFKYVNDSMGHPIGDALLQHVAHLLQKGLRPGDMVCRLAGDEFTVLARGVNTVEGARLLGDRILREVRTVFSVNGVEIQSNASMGVALMPMHASNETDMMRFADTALYRAKQEGKGRCIVYDESMAAQALAKAKTVRELAKGIAQDELFLVYQPKYHLASGSLTGHEALVRWKHPVRGTVYPNDFITLAEESGQIAELGNWVLRRAVRQIREWREDGKGWHKVAVNVSALQLKNDEFVKLVAAVLAEQKVPGRYLQLELTESSLAADSKRARALLHELRHLGVTVAIDDFGTGYSSLSTLSQFEIDCLKVDRSFVNDILTEDGNSICRAIVSLGHSLGMSIVAEGVETPEQATALAQLGCNEVQGYLFAKPLAPEVAVTLLQATAYIPSEPAVEGPLGQQDAPQRTRLTLAS